MNNYYKKKSKINISFPGSIESELDLNNINDTKRKLEKIIQKKGGKNVRDLIEKYFSISWCENNLVVPVSSYFDKSLDIEIIKIAVADFSYIDSLSEDIKKQLNKKNARCEVKELEIKEIKKILALAKNERSSNKATISDFDLKTDSSTKELYKGINSDINELIDIENLDFESPDDFEFQEEIEFYNDNEDTIYIDSYDIKNNQDLVIKALKIYFSDNLPEYNLTLIKDDIYKIGELTTKIIISNPLTDFIFLSKSNIVDDLFSSKIFLLAEVNDEARSVYFKGLITNKELLEIYNDEISNYENNLKIDKAYFRGGIERFYSLINVKKNPFIKQNSKLIKKFLSTKFYLSLRKLIPKKVSNELLIESFEKISFLLKNGNPLLDTIYSTSESTNNKDLKELYKNVYNSLILGKQLSECLYPFKNIIDISIIQMLEIGEETGKLSNVFKVCAEKLKKM